MRYAPSVGNQEEDGLFQGLQSDQLEGALEALLFVTDEPVNAIVMADMLEIEPAQAEEALGRLRDRLASEGSGIVLREVAGGWRLFTHPAYHELVEKYVVSWDTRKLSQAALETLSIVAYSQPITRARISAVRGVNSDSSVNSLVEKGLLREVGTEDAPGNPVLYATTQTFLEKFGLRSVADLPPLESFAPDEETRRFVAERLSASRMTEGLSVPEGLTAGEASEDATALLAFEGEGPNGEEVRRDRDGAGQASLFEGEGGRLEDADTPLSFEGAENPDMQDAMRHAMARAFAQASGAVEKIDFNELRFED